MSPLPFLYNAGLSLTTILGAISNAVFSEFGIANYSSTLFGWLFTGALLVLFGVAVAKWFIHILP